MCSTGSRTSNRSGSISTSTNHELPWVQYGQTVEIKSEAIPARVSPAASGSSIPVLNEETRTVKVLVNIANTEQKLKPGMYRQRGDSRRAVWRTASPRPPESKASGPARCTRSCCKRRPANARSAKWRSCRFRARPRAPKPEGEQLLLAVPVTAVLDSGVRKLVYVEKEQGRVRSSGDRDRSREPTTSYLVLSGLNEGDNVVDAREFSARQPIPDPRSAELVLQGRPGGHPRSPPRRRVICRNTRWAPLPPPRLVPPIPPAGGIRTRPAGQHEHQP